MSSFASLLSAQGHALVLPKTHDEEISRYVSTQSTERGSAERRPFRRQVDFWAFSIATALAMDLQPMENSPSRWGKTFIYTSQNILDEDICTLLVVITVAKVGYDDPEVGEPKRIIDLANRLAGAGCPMVLKKLSEDTLRTTPLDRVIDFARLLQDNEAE